jgi:hypothetical protein
MAVVGHLYAVAKKLKVQNETKSKSSYGTKQVIPRLVNTFRADVDSGLGDRPVTQAVAPPLVNWQHLDGVRYRVDRLLVAATWTRSIRPWDWMASWARKRLVEVRGRQSAGEYGRALRIFANAD